ncbi:DUF465 domain-containing protein [Glycocaulis profundi]|nr:DUF465 domain-containing protein [Glycocaulis profundi]
MYGEPDEASLRATLDELRREHRSVDADVQAAQDCGVQDQLKIMRLKRRKLSLKDQISRLEDQLNPDIIA